MKSFLVLIVGFASVLATASLEPQFFYQPVAAPPIETELSGLDRQRLRERKQSLEAELSRLLIVEWRDGETIALPLETLPPNYSAMPSAGFEGSLLNIKEYGPADDEARLRHVPYDPSIP